MAVVRNKRIGTPKLYKNLEEIFINSWWVILFFIVCYLCFERGLRKRDQDFDKLQTQYLGLQNEKKQASAQKENLLLQINSQSDPDWIELTLMKGLGLVSEGQIKVLFTDQPDSWHTSGDTNSLHMQQ